MLQNMIIRKLENKDLKKVYILGKEQFEGENWFTLKYIKETFKGHGYYFGAYEKNKLIGVILVNRFDQPKLWIFFLEVTKEYRKRGIATALLNKVEKVAPKNYSMLLTDFEKTDKEALSFYKKHGFKKQAKIKDWYGKDAEGLIYSKQLY